MVKTSKNTTATTVHADTKLIDVVKLGKPLDFSFMSLKTLHNLENEQPRTIRLQGVPERGAKMKFVSASLWLNHNNLSNLKHLKSIVDDLFEFPSYLSWIDVSCNELKLVEQELFQFPNLRILYMHGNHISDLEEVLKLKRLTNLRTLTLHGNPIYRLMNYRRYVSYFLPQIRMLDFSLITHQERKLVIPIPCSFMKSEVEKTAQ